MKKKTLRVTNEDITLGHRSSFCECPIARAVKRAFQVKRTGRKVTVRADMIIVGELHDTTPVWVGHLSPKMQKFITSFDTGKPVAAFTTTLNFR